MMSFGKWKTYTVRCGVGVLMVCAVAVAQAYEAGKTYRFTVLHTNDTHGRFWQNENGEYGFPAQKTLINRIRKEVAAQGGEVLLLSAGDFNTGVPESDLQDARPDIEGMNLLGYEAAALGNHEFDKPMAVLEKQMKWAHFPLLSANVRVRATDRLLVQPYTVLRKGGLKFGVVGLTTEDTAQLSARAGDVYFDPSRFSARHTLQRLNATENPDVRIALTHLGYYFDGQHGNSAPGDVSLARSLPKNAFDLIIGGHSHTTVCMNEDGSLNKKFQPGDDCRPDYQNGTWIVQAGYGGKYLGRADFEFKDGQTKLVSYRLIPVNLKKAVKKADGRTEYRLYDKEIPADEAVSAALKPYQALGQQWLGLKVGNTKAAFDGSREVVRHRQAALGRFLANVQQKRFKADMSLMNGGGIRSSLPEGDITYKDILRVQPFGNTIGLVHLSGQELAEYLQQVALHQEGSGGYPHFSGNVSMTVNRTDKAVNNIRIGGEDLDAARQYTLVLSDFLANGGDGYPKLKTHPKYQDTGFVDAEIVKEYFEKNPDLNPADFEPKNEIVFQ